jgi:MFS family permease
MTAQRIIRTYYGIAATTTLAQALIWGVNTLFLLSVGFDIFEVMLINAAYTVAQVVFEVPTGVVADTVGRRVSYLLAVATILVSTLLYVGFGLAGYGLWPFAAASALLGVGYTFYTGAVDAWMVDALHSVGYEGRLEPIFARYGITFGISLPVKQGWLNARIPSEQRATIISLDALFGEGGSTVGQVGLGWMSQRFSIPLAWLVGGAIEAVAVPLLGAARKAEKEHPAESLPWAQEQAGGAAAAAGPAMEVETPGCFGLEPGATCVPGDEPGATPGDERVA